jgi:hypothetical protein
MNAIDIEKLNQLISRTDISGNDKIKWLTDFIDSREFGQQERSYSEAIEFAEWIRIKDFQTTSKNNWIGLDMKYYTTQELFEQFKKK